jgi:hypothetical protein
MTFKDIFLGFINFAAFFSMLYPPLMCPWDDIKEKKHKK